MRACAESHTRIHFDAKSAGRRWVVTPLRHEEKSRTHAHRLQPAPRLFHPIARFLDAPSGATPREFARKTPRDVIVIKKCAQPATAVRQVRLRNASRTTLPKFGDEQVFFLLPAFQIEREHGL